MPEERTIPVPAEHREFTVKVNGRVIERVNQLLSASVTKMAGKISAARLVYLDGNASAGSFPLSNSDVFIPGKSIEIEAGSQGNIVSLFKGIIIRQSIKIRDHSSPQLIVDCRHKAIKLTVGRKNAYFFDKKDSEVIETIIGNAAIQGSIEDTSVVHKQLVQYYSTDWDFLMTRAQANGKLVYTNDDTIVVKKPVYPGQAVFTLHYGATILEMDAEIDSRYQYRGVKSFSWDAANQELIENEANDPGSQASGNLSAEDLSETVGLDHLRLQQGMLTEAESRAWADAKWHQSAMNRVSGRIKCEGIGNIQPGDTVQLSGVGDRFNGDLLVSGIRQSFDPADGWKTNLQFGNDDSWFGSDDEITAPKAGALLPAVNGLQIGIVVDNEDPEGEFRVRVKMPLVDNAESGTWARVSTLDAGNQRGFFFRPEVGDEVILGFLDDDPRQAIILGMLHSSALAAPLTGSNENHEKLYQSREGLKLYFNDEKKVIRLETPAGKKFIMDDGEEQLIRLEDENGNKFEMNAQGIKIESAMALELKAVTDLKLEGLNLGIKGSASMKAEASGSLELTSSGSMVIKGSIVQIN